MKAHEAFLDTSDHHVVVGPDGGSGAGVMEKQPELERAGQKRTARAGLAQPRRGVGVRPGRAMPAGPPQQVDRGVEPDTRIPPQRVEERRDPADELRAERGPRQHLDHRRLGSHRTQHHGQAVGIAVRPRADITHRHTGHRDVNLRTISRSRSRRSHGSRDAASSQRRNQRQAWPAAGHSPAGHSASWNLATVMRRRGVRAKNGCDGDSTRWVDKTDVGLVRITCRRSSPGSPLPGRLTAAPVIVDC